MNDYYSDSQEHIADELLLVDLLMHARVVRHRAATRVKDDGFQGLYVAEEEIDALLDGGAPGGTRATAVGPGRGQGERLSEAAASLRRSIDDKVKLSLEQRVPLRLVRLAYLYGLTTAELEILTICLAPHVDLKYQRLFAYLQDDVTRKSPTVGLLIALLSESPDDAIALRSMFSRRKALFREHLLEFVDDPYEKSKALPAREVTIDGRIADYLLGCDDLDHRLANIAELHDNEPSLEELALPEEIVARLLDFVGFYRKAGTNENFLFSLSGPYGPQKKEVAAAICRELGVALLVVDVPALRGSGVGFEQGIGLVLRESRLLPAALYFEGCDCLVEREDSELLRRCFSREVDAQSFLSFLSSAATLNLQGSFGRQRFIEIDLPVPDYEQRREIWTQCLAGHSVAQDVDVRAVAAKYSLTRGQIIDAVATARTYALWRSPQGSEITEEDVRRACHAHSNQSLDKLAQRIEPKYRWDDIVLYEDTVGQLKDIVEMVAYKPIVHDAWGFDRKLSVGKGVSALFYGEPGTGKTMAANIIANELGMELYKIDISTVVSKYVGETEKNLSRIFFEAENSNAVLFFDEADALFGKRTEVKDAHDRYANVEVSYLLQRIEEFSGIVILASNFSQNIDEAFERRLRFIVQFPFPDEQSRLRIWQNVFPEETPLEPDIDFALLAGKLRISGGNIANIALTAAFYAARSGGPVGFEHLLRACRNEYRKTGRLWNAKELELVAPGG